VYQNTKTISEDARLVFILQPAVPPYRTPFFAELKRLGQASNVVYVVGADVSETNNGKEADFRSELEVKAIAAKKFRFIKGRPLLKHQIPQDLLGADLVIAEYALRNLMVFKWAYLGGVKRLALWGHGKTYTADNTAVEEWIKTKLANKCDWFFGYTQKGVDSVVGKGFQTTCTTVVQNSTDTKELKRLHEAVEQKAIDEFKSKFTIGNGSIGVFVGALDPSKRLDFLIESAVEIQSQIPDFELLVFGSGEELENVLTSCEKFPFIKFCGRADQETQALISKVARFIMMPGRVGLIAVDSLALGLPIVTTNWSLHAPEFEYLSNGRNSMVCNNKVEDYVAGIIDLIRDDFKLDELRSNCLEDSKRYTIEVMASNFHDGVMKALNEIKPRV